MLENLYVGKHLSADAMLETMDAVVEFLDGIIAEMDEALDLVGAIAETVKKVTRREKARALKAIAEKIHLRNFPVYVMRMPKTLMFAEFWNGGCELCRNFISTRIALRKISVWRLR